MHLCGPNLPETTISFSEQYYTPSELNLQLLAGTGLGHNEDLVQSLKLHTSKLSYPVGWDNLYCRYL